MILPYLPDCVCHTPLLPSLKLSQSPRNAVRDRAAYRVAQFAFCTLSTTTRASNHYSTLVKNASHLFCAEALRPQSSVLMLDFFKPYLNQHKQLPLPWSNTTEQRSVQETLQLNVEAPQLLFNVFDLFLFRSGGKWA